MKTLLFRSCSLAAMLALASFFGGCDQEQAHSAQVTDAAINPAPAETLAVDTNQLDQNTEDQDAADQDLADAPGKVISTPDTASTNVLNNPQLNDFVKLVQAGVGESVLLAYVTNSPTAFNLSSDDILYLNDLGTPEPVVSAMLQRDQHFNANATTSAGAQVAPAPVTPEPYVDPNAMTQAPAVAPPLTPSADIEQEVAQAPNVSYSYFYDSLSPYGNWVDIEGYGPCWQPTAVAVNVGWQPYCDHGHWAYTDCGWCWVSDYSWGWAPFHYGRWFHHNRWGWCWAPDTVWGPAWVSWRYSNTHCGWAPLPPAACYRPGFGFTYLGHSVGFNFSFGLSVNRFVFVPLNHFHDRSPGRFRVEHREVTKIYNTTTVNNRIIRGNNNTLINPGVPVDRVAAATHTDIRPIRIRADADAPRSTQLGRDGRSLSVYRPALPTPKTANNPRLVGEGVQPAPHFDLHSRVNRPQPAQTTRNPMMPAVPERRPIVSNPRAITPSENPGRDNRENRFSQPNTERPGSLILRGSDRPTPSRPDNSPGTTIQNPRRGPTFQPQTPTQPQPFAPAENTRRTLAPPVPQPTETAPQQPNPAPPSFNRPDNSVRHREMEAPQRALPQQQPVMPSVRQEPPPRVFEAPRGTPRMNEQNPNPGFRSEPAFRPAPVAPSRPAPEVRSAPVQPSAPAREIRQDNSGGRGNGNGNGNANGNANDNGNGRSRR